MTWEKEEKTMKHRIKILLLAVLIAALCNCMLMIGMTKKKENNTIPKDASLICEETVSPNKDYITDEKDLVNYTVRVYQEKNNDIIVYAESNSPLFDEAQYIVICAHAITPPPTMSISNGPPSWAAPKRARKMRSDWHTFRSQKTGKCSMKRRSALWRKR